MKTETKGNNAPRILNKLLISGNITFVLFFFFGPAKEIPTARLITFIRLEVPRANIRSVSTQIISSNIDNIDRGLTALNIVDIRAKIARNTNNDVRYITQINIEYGAADHRSGTENVCTPN